MLMLNAYQLQWYVDFGSWSVSLYFAINIQLTFLGENSAPEGKEGWLLIHPF